MYLLFADTLPFTHREFAFQLQDGRFLRYFSFEKMDDLKATLKQHIPVAISLGAVYRVQVGENGLIV